ncbi:MAG: DUF4276 family protein [Magnetococcales bacterium]|nr:DUF4276 family protein [Magnetococcales bacterium]
MGDSPPLPVKLVFLLEEPSMKEVLDGVLHRLGLPSEVTFQCVPHQGKQDLERSIPNKLRGWNDPDHDIRFVVLRDNDGHPRCAELKQRLAKLCSDNGRPDALIRLACQEMESWLLGDPNAIAVGFEDQTLVKKIGNKAKFRDPDHLLKPSEELKALILGYQKRSGARKIAPYLDPDLNRSRSFQVFVNGLQRLVQDVTPA